MTGPSAASPSVRWSVVAAGLVVLVVAVWRIAAAADGIGIETVRVDDVPVTVMVPADPHPPGVVVAHGFAGSRQLMRSFGLALAHHGYVVALPDLAGHGGNPAPLDGDGDVLVADVLRARDLLVDGYGVSDDEVVLLGHSMGSGAVMRAAIERPDRVAGVVAVSPTDADVTPELPPDLKLLAGALEGRFVANAEDLLDRAGGAGGVPGEDGRARDLEVIPGVEHVTILFSPRAHAAAARWLDAVVDREPRPSRPVWVIGWWLAALLGTVVAWRGAAPSLVGAFGGAPDRGGVRGGGVRTHRVARRGGDVAERRRYLGMAVGALTGPVILAAVAVVLPLTELGGMLVGPVLAAWFAIAGGIWWGIGLRAARPGAWELASGVLLLAVLLLAFGALAPWVWLPLLPSTARALYVLPFAVLTLPWLIVFVAGFRSRRGWQAVGWWALCSVSLLVGVAVAAVLVPGLGFVLLLLPLLPPLLALVAAVTAPWVRATGQLWGPAAAGAVLLGWVMAVLFPLT